MKRLGLWLLRNGSDPALLRSVSILTSAILLLVLLVAMEIGDRESRLDDVYSAKEAVYFKEVAFGSDPEASPAGEGLPVGEQGEFQDAKIEIMG